MRNTLVFAFLTILLLTSCSYYNVVSIASDKTKQTSSGLIFENDTIRITYKFWAKNGVMNFDIYNKIDMPLYFDWKKSAYIPNDKMMSYWQDETNTVGYSSSRAYSLYGGGIGANSKSKTKAEYEITQR